MRGICDRRVDGRKFRVVATGLYLRQRTLSVPFHQFVLQPSLTSLEARLVIKGSILVRPFWFYAFRLHAAMGTAFVLPRRIGGVRARDGATSARPRAARPDCNRRAMATDVRIAGSDARALPNVGRSPQRCRVGSELQIERNPFRHLGGMLG